MGSRSGKREWYSGLLFSLQILCSGDGRQGAGCAAPIESTSVPPPGVVLPLLVCRETGAFSTGIVTAILGLIGDTGISSELALWR